MPFLKIISSPYYSMLHNLRVFCHYKLQFSTCIHELSRSAVKVFTFEIQWAETSVWANIEAFFLIFVWSRYKGSIIKRKVGLCLILILVNKQVISLCVFVNIENQDCTVWTGNQSRNSTN